MVYLYRLDDMTFEIVLYNLCLNLKGKSDLANE